MTDGRSSARELLPSAAEASRCPDALWDVAFDPRSQDAVEVLYAVVLCEENAAQADGLTGLIAIARLLREDLLQHVHNADSQLVAVDLHTLILATSLGPAVLAVWQHEASVAYDWLLWSLTETWELDGEHTLHAEWVDAATESVLPGAVTDLVVPWLTALYRYDWRYAGLPDAALLFLSTAGQLAAQPTDASLELAGALLSWAGAGRLPADDPASRSVAAVLDRVRALADTPGVSKALAQPALRLLAVCSGSVTGEDIASRSQELLERFGADLTPTERLEVLGNVLPGGGHGVAARLDEFVDLAKRQSLTCASLSPGQAGPGRARGAMHTLIEAPLVALLRAGEVAAAVRLLSAWRGIPDDEGLTAVPLVGLHDRDEGLSWTCEGRPPLTPPTGVTHNEYVLAANAFLGTTATKRLGPPLPLNVPDRGRGVPDRTKGATFETVATRFLGLAGAESARQAAVNAGQSPSTIIVIPTQQAPVQPLMLRRLGWTLPLSMSLRQPKPDRAIHTAVVWIGESFFAQRESDAVVGALRAGAVDVTVRDSETMSRELFLDDYRSDQFDLFWVGSHGMFDPMAPSAGYLMLKDDERVSGVDLELDHLGADGRRLLVLNACDSGATALIGGIGELGLASSAVGPAQAVVGHQWPVMSSTVAPVFAAVLASAIVGTAGFFQAYASAVTVLSSGPDCILGALGTSAEGLAQVVEDNPSDFEDLAGWSSAAFYE